MSKNFYCIINDVKTHTILCNKLVKYPTKLLHFFMHHLKRHCIAIRHFSFYLHTSLLMHAGVLMHPEITWLHCKYLLFIKFLNVSLNYLIISRMVKWLTCTGGGLNEPVTKTSSSALFICCNQLNNHWMVIFDKIFLFSVHFCFSFEVTTSWMRHYNITQ